MPKKRKRRESFKELEARWYKKLKDEGFQDIEDTRQKDRPLKEWHSFKFSGRRTPDRKACNPTHIGEAQQYYRLVDLFLSDFPYGGLGLLGRRMEMRILTLHAQGMSLRAIGEELNIHYLQAHLVVTAMKKRILRAA